MSAHDHGNCQLCDEQEERIRTLEAALRLVVVEYERDSGCAISLKAEEAVRVALDGEPTETPPITDEHIRSGHKYVDDFTQSHQHYWMGEEYQHVTHTHDAVEQPKKREGD